MFTFKFSHLFINDNSGGAWEDLIKMVEKIRNEKKMKRKWKVNPEDILFRWKIVNAKYEKIYTF